MWWEMGGMMLAEESASAIPRTMALILQTHKAMWALPAVGGVNRCAQAVNTIHTIADGIACAAGDGVNDAA